MPSVPRRVATHGRGEAGSAGAAFVAAAGLALVGFVVIANAITMVFVRGAVRAAVEEAARVGGRSDAPVAECEARARSVLDALLAPKARRGIEVSCELDGDPPAVRARAWVTLEAWLPGFPSWSFGTEARSRREVLE